MSVDSFLFYEKANNNKKFNKKYPFEISHLLLILKAFQLWIGLHISTNYRGKADIIISILKMIKLKLRALETCPST